MAQDAYGKEIKVGDRILYGTHEGSGSGMIREYVVTQLDPYKTTSYTSRFDEETQKWKWDHFEHDTARVLARPIVNRRVEKWARSMRPVPLTHPERIVVISGVDLTRRYGEPEEEGGAC